MKDFGAVGVDVGGNEGDVCNYSMRLDTYGCGCQHDCSYCYAKSLLEFRGLWNPQNPSVAPIQKISKEIRKIPSGKIIRMGGMTDCFQPCERLYKNTYKTIKLLNKRRVGYLIVTKSPMIAEDEYIDLMDKDLAHVQFTLTFTDDEQYRETGIEKAPIPSKRIEAIEKLEASGIDTCIRLLPYIPEFIDLDVLDEIKCDKVLVEFLRVNHWIEKWLGNKCDLSMYTKNFHGYNHLPFKIKKELVDRMSNKHTITVCDFEPEHLDYWKKEYNPNKDDCCNLRK